MKSYDITPLDRFSSVGHCIYFWGQLFPADYFSVTILQPGNAIWRHRSDTWTMFTYNQWAWGHLAFAWHPKVIWQEILRTFFLIWVWKFWHAFLKIRSTPSRGLCVKRKGMVNGWLYRKYKPQWNRHHYSDVIMTTVESQITSLTFVYSTVCSDGDQRKHQSSASLAFVWGIHRDRWIPRAKGQ